MKSPGVVGGDQGSTLPADRNGPTVAGSCDPGSAALENTPTHRPNIADETRTAARPEPNGQGSHTEPLVPLRYRDQGRYEIVTEHGRGGLGRVFRARDKELGREVALKELIHRSQSSELRFFREAIVTARLEHPGIVPVHEAGRWPDGTPFYAMKLVAGRPLSDLIIERTTFEQRLSLVSHVIAVADAIAYAHDRGVIHRDLKPSNVIVGEYGETVVIDWGLAKQLGDQDAIGQQQVTPEVAPSSELTATGAVLGTPAFMPPEQALGRDVDERADVFALGAMLANVIAGAPVKAFERVPRGLRDLVAIAELAMSSDRSRRYASASSFASDLRSFIARRPVEARTYGPFGRLALLVGRHRNSMVAGAAVLVALVPVLLFAFVNAERQRRDEAAARLAAEKAEVAADGARDDLLLQSAALQIEKDPTSALARLEAYDGTDLAHHQRLSAEAVGRGVADLVIKPHYDAVLMVDVLSNGDVVSVGRDGVARLVAGSGSAVLASDVDAALPARGVAAFAANSDKVAFWARDGALRLADPITSKVETVPTPGGPGPHRLAIDSEGLRVAIYADGAMWVVRADGTVVVKRSEPSVSSFAFLGSALILTTDQGVEHVSGEGTRRLSSRPASGKIVANEQYAVWRDGQDSLVFSDGSANLGYAHACLESVSDYAIAAKASLAVFICSDGTVGSAELSRGTTAYCFRAPAGRAIVSVSELGRYVVAGGTDGVVHYFDAAVGYHRAYRGHAAPITAFAVREQPDAVVSSDRDGVIRRWRLGPVVPQRLFSVPSLVYNVASLNDAGSLVVDGADGVVRVWDHRQRRLLELERVHGGAVYGLDVSDGELITSGLDGQVVLWSGAPLAPVRRYKETNLFTDAEFVRASRWIASHSTGSELHFWNRNSSEDTRTYSFPAPIRFLESLSSGGVVVVLENSELWTAAPDELPHRRFAVSGDVTLVTVSRNGEFVALGTAQGRVFVYETTSWSVVYENHVAGSVRNLALSTDAATIAISAEPSGVVVERIASREAVIRTEMLRGRALAFTRDGQYLVVACGDGTLWVFDGGRRRWTVVAVSTTELIAAFFDTGDDAVVVLDQGGQLFTLQMKSILESQTENSHAE